uniref:Uncharacterized protein n=1 Tax=Chlamydomonas euryale TaxID=1486919 RepID=A0A7R9YUG4_9CHLO
MCVDDNGGKTFMTQAGGGGHGEGETDHVTGGMQSMSLGAARASVSGQDIFGDDVVSGTCSPSQMPDGRSGAPPMFRRLVEPSVPERGREDDPVYGWHNKFVEVRQRARESLTQALYERSAGRFKARSYAKMGTNLAGLLMADLEQVKGKKTPYVSLRKAPENPYAKMEETWEQQEEARRARTQRAHALDPEELRVMQRFYDQLCALVEAQRTSDPLSLMVVHKVRAALEGGASLNRSLLSAIVDHVADFCRGCGLMAHNKYVLAVLTFIAKCTGVPMPELDALLVNAGICIVVFGMGEPPQRDDETARTARKPSAVNARALSTGRLASSPSMSRQTTELETAAENVLSQLPLVAATQGEEEGASPQLPQPAAP